MFWHLCLPGDRSPYEYCHETKLVRIAIDHLHDDYRSELNRLLTQVSLRKEMQELRNLHKRTVRGDDDDDDGVDVDNSIIAAGPKVDKFDDAHDRAFSSEWLPSFKELSSCLVDAWSDRERRNITSTTAKGGLPRQ